MPIIGHGQKRNKKNPKENQKKHHHHQNQPMKKNPQKNNFCKDQVKGLACKETVKVTRFDSLLQLILGLRVVYSSRN